MRNRQKHCRWCGTAYIALKPINRDGFDKPSCKQAHYRAFKKWVTRRTMISTRSAGGRRRSK